MRPRDIYRMIEVGADLLRLILRAVLIWRQE